MTVLPSMRRGGLIGAFSRMVLGLMLFCSSMILVLPTPVAAGEGSAPRQCHRFGIDYDSHHALVGFVLSKRCIDRPGIRALIVRVSLTRCDLECTRVLKREIECLPMDGPCRRRFSFAHAPVEAAEYRARLSYASTGWRVVAGWSTRVKDCYSAIEYAFC